MTRHGGQATDIRNEEGRVLWESQTARWSLFQFDDLKGQLRNRCLQNVPDEFQIGSRVIVHDAVAQTGYLQPWNRRVSLLEFGGKLLCRLSGYLEIAHRCVDRLFVSEK